MEVEFIEADDDGRISMPGNCAFLIGITPETDKMLFGFYSAVASALDLTIPLDRMVINEHKGKVLLDLLRFAVEFGEVGHDGKIVLDLEHAMKWANEKFDSMQPPRKPPGKPN